MTYPLRIVTEAHNVGFWLTPPEVMGPLQAEFDFNFDACPYPCPPDFDGLTCDWGTRTYCNPPFKGGVMVWARKAIVEHAKGNMVVLILPHRAVQWCTAPLLEAGAETRLTKPIDWLNPKGERRGKAGANVCVLYILRPA